MFEILCHLIYALSWILWISDLLLIVDFCIYSREQTRCSSTAGVLGGSVDLTTAQARPAKHNEEDILARLLKYINDVTMSTVRQNSWTEIGRKLSFSWMTTKGKCRCKAVSTLNGSVYLWICLKTGKQSPQRGIEKTEDSKGWNGNVLYTDDIQMWNRSAPMRKEKKTTCFKLPSLHLRFFQGLNEIFILQIKWSAASWWRQPLGAAAGLTSLYIWCILAHHDTMMDRGSRAQQQRTWSPPVVTSDRHFPSTERESCSWHLDPAGSVTEAKANRWCFKTDKQKFNVSIKGLGRLLRPIKSSLGSV